MVRSRSTALALGVACLFVGALVAAEPSVVSGPQVNKKLPGPFNPLNVTGDFAGDRQCLFCHFGESPVAMVFAREASPEVTKLLKKLDALTVSNKEREMGSFVVFCNDAEGLDKKLKEVAEKEKLQKIILTIDNPAGPDGYNVHKDADVTVVFYIDRTVKANFAFKKGELNDKKIDEIAAAITKGLPEKK